MPVNWNMGIAPDAGGNALNAFESGRKARDEMQGRNALAAYATDPNDQNLNALAQSQPQFVIQQKQQMAQQQAGLIEKHRAEMGLMAKLAEQVKDEGSYQQALQVAKQYGLDVSQAPPNYDPNWASQMGMIANAFLKDDGKTLSGIAKELTDAGYQPGTPQFMQAMTGVINNKYASDYVDEQGNTRRRSALDLQGAGQQGQPAAPPQGQNVLTPEQLHGNVASMGAGPVADWIRSSGVVVQIANEADYNLLPPGASYIDPAGHQRVKGQ